MDRQTIGVHHRVNGQALHEREGRISRAISTAASTMDIAVVGPPVEAEVPSSSAYQVENQFGWKLASRGCVFRTGLRAADLTLRFTWLARAGTRCDRSA
jgi:hypothetical protein